MRRCIRKIKNFYWTIRRFIRNFIRWFPMLIDDSDFDYAYLIKIMNRKLTFMEKFFLSDRTYTLNAHKYGREIQTARTLTDRILKDDYSDEYFRTSRSKLFLHRDYLKQQDINYLFKIMSKKIQKWWD